MGTEIVCVPNNAAAWYWAFRIDGKPHEQGTAPSYKEGMAAARLARQLWEDRTIEHTDDARQD